MRGPLTAPWKRPGRLIAGGALPTAATSSASGPGALRGDHWMSPSNCALPRSAASPSSTAGARPAGPGAGRVASMEADTAAAEHRPGRRLVVGRVNRRVDGLARPPHTTRSCARRGTFQWRHRRRAEERRTVGVAIVELVTATTTRTGLTVHAELDGAPIGWASRSPNNELTAVLTIGMNSTAEGTAPWLPNPSLNPLVPRQSWFA
jgi:hypothetical protein